MRENYRKMTGGKRMVEVGRRDYVWGESNREWQETGLPVMKYKQWRFIAPISLQAATELGKLQRV